MTIEELKRELRAGEYAWPGGYPKYFIAIDGEVLSFNAVRDNYKLVLDSMKNDIQDGWYIVDVSINWEDNQLTCAHTGKRIEAAYEE